MWLVVVKGTVDFSQSAAAPPMADGTSTSLIYPAMWELLEPNGHIMGWGGLYQDTDLNLDGPAVAVYSITPQVITNK